jgi:aspartate racemase
MGCNNHESWKDAFQVELMMKTLGIIGGMGPEATSDLFRKIIELTPATKDQDHIHIIIDNYPQIPDRTANLLAGGKDPLPYLVKSAQLLERAGVDALIMPCNTAHAFLLRLKAVVKLDFISIIDASVAAVKEIAPQAKTVLPLITTGTKAAGLYENGLIAAGYSVIDLPDDLQANVMSAIYDGVKKGHTAELLPLYQATLDRIATELRPDVLLAGCTEIPILMAQAKTQIPVVDATLELARAAVRFAMD